jgi:hypothetical protein
MDTNDPYTIPRRTLDTSKPDLDKRYDECADLVHATPGSHRYVGGVIAGYLERYMRLNAVAADLKSVEDADTQPLCPGCYTLILIEALLELARSQKQDVRERCLYMAREFARLAEEARKGEPLLIAIEGDKL